MLHLHNIFVVGHKRKGGNNTCRRLRLGLLCRCVTQYNTVSLYQYGIILSSRGCYKQMSTLEVEVESLRVLDCAVLTPLYIDTLSLAIV